MNIVRAALLLSGLVILPSMALRAAPPDTPPAKEATGSPAGQSTAKPADAAPAVAAKPDEALPSVPVPQFERVQSKIDNWKETLDRADSALHVRSIAEATLNDLRDQATTVQNDARDVITFLTPRLEAASARAAELTPDPKAPTPQSDAIKLERAKLLAEIGAQQSVIQQAKLLNVRSQQILDTISDRRRTIFTDSVLQRSDSLINPSFWIDVVARVPEATGRIVDLLSRWVSVLAAQPWRAASGFVIAAIVVLGFWLSPWRRWQMRWTARDVNVNPSPLRKASSAAAIVMAGTVIPGVVLLVFYQALMALGVLPEEVSAIVRALFIGIVFAFFFVRLTVAVLAPGLPKWRLVDVEDTTADGMVPVAITLVLVIIAGIVLDATNLAINAPLDLLIASQGVVAITKALLFMTALRVATGAEADDDDAATARNVKRSVWRLLIPLGWVMATAAICGSLGGYVAFGRFVSGEMIVVVAMLMSVVLLNQFSDAIIATTFAFHGKVGRFLRLTAGLGGSAVRQIAAVLYGSVQLLLIAVAAFMILTTWGIQSGDVIGSMTSAFFGFKVGSFTISPSAILGAIVVLIVGVMATRSIQRWLEARFLPETSLDDGVRSSIRTGIGYVGVILATIVALSYVGLNLQNIAIVAGALSVGIGFGLQSIINNFVSGLILLVERPIKVGDRIEVGTRMGVVRRINVRATEIVTYDNLSVIVPNADLISGQVVNWMHGSFSARLSVMVGTSYDADPDQVIAILLEIATGNPRALKSPAPFAIFSNFGADALEFTVFFHVGNIGVDAGAANEVRLEILKRFRKEGIEIPFAQRDFRVRDLDRIEQLVRDVSSANSAQSGKAPPDDK